MANCGGGGGDVVIPISQPRNGGQRGHRQEAARLPLDIIITEIAARSDAATLVRCAATCRAARRRVTEDASLRFRDTGRFLLPLLRGHLVGSKTYDYVGGRGRVKTDVYLVDTTTADATRLVEATFVSAAAEAEMLMDPVPMDSRGGLVLIGATATAPPLPRHQRLLVCNPATGRRLVLPPEPEPFPDGGCIRKQYVLLVGDRDDGEGGAGAGAAVGRPFQVLKMNLTLSHQSPSYHRLSVQTFSSEDGSWSPLTEIPTPNIFGRSICFESLKKVLVVGDVVHWLCLTNVGSYVLMLHVREARVSETTLPATFHCNDPWTRSYLLATDSARGSLVVLVADMENNIRAWEQFKGTKSKMMWKAWPQVLIDREAILGFNDEVEAVLQYNDGVATWWMDGSKRPFELSWFGERSGVVLLRIHGCRLLWLDLHSKKIVRCFCSDHMSYAQMYCPYEMDLSSWTPTFGSAITI